MFGEAIMASFVLAEVDKKKTIMLPKENNWV
jgi:hypothetical protein